MTKLVFLDDLCDDSVPASFDDLISGGAISIGNFDGVHRGHAWLLGQVRTMADRLGGPAVAVTFAPHPAQILRPDSAPKQLTWLELRAERMATLGIDALVVCPTNESLLRLSAEQFFIRLVRDRLQARGIVEGPNFYFGHQRQGDMKMLKRLAQEHHMQCVVATALHDKPSDWATKPDHQATPQQQAMISSSSIRQAIAQGDIVHANNQCGFAHCIRGVVAPGEQRGRTIGFPTANLEKIDGAIPADGVYAGIAQTKQAEFKAAIHIGPNPTFEREDSSSRKVEVHLLGYDGNLYDQTLRVEFIDRLRGVEKFPTTESLVNQLQRDVAAANQIVSLNG